MDILNYNATADSIAANLSNILNSITSAWPDFNSDPSQLKVFQDIQAQLGSDSLWHSFPTIAIERIQSIRDNYAANHTLTKEEENAWSQVMATIEHAFADRDELNTFFLNLHNVLTDRVTWTESKVSYVAALAILGQSLIINLGDKDRTIWSMMLAPLQAIPGAGGALNTVANGVVKLCVAGGGVEVNPALAAISAVQGEINGKLADILATIVTTLTHLQTSASTDYGKLQTMHDLLVIPGAELPATLVFSDDALMQAEIELWKPIMNAGWQIQIGESGEMGSTLNNAFIDDDSFDRFNAYNSPTSGFFYDQIMKGWSTDVKSPGDSNGTGEEGVIGDPGYWARFRVLVTVADDWLSTTANSRLFGDLAVSRADIYDGVNGWALIGNGDTCTHFDWRA